MCFSALALAGANRHQAGIISAQELAGLDLGGTELVVLSACETGLGSMGKGEYDNAIVGFRRASVLRDRLDNDLFKE